MRITPKPVPGVYRQRCGRDRLATNPLNAAELTAVPDDRILEIYNALVLSFNERRAASLSPDDPKTVIRQRFAQPPVKRQDCAAERKTQKRDDWRIPAHI